MRPAVEWQAHKHRSPAITRQQKAITPEIIETHSALTNGVEQPREASAREQLQRQQMMALQARIVIVRTALIYLAEQQRLRAVTAGRGMDGGMAMDRRSAGCFVIA